MTGRKSLMERARERAWAIHRRNCRPCACDSLSQADREKAAREVTRPAPGLTRGQDNREMIQRLQGVSAGLWDRYGG